MQVIDFPWAWRAVMNAERGIEYSLPAQELITGPAKEKPMNFISSQCICGGKNFRGLCRWCAMLHAGKRVIQRSKRVDLFYI